MVDSLEYYKEILSDYRRTEGSLHDRARSIIEECDEFYQSDVPDSAEITFQDDGVWVVWDEWHGTGCGESYHNSEKFPYEYLWTDIYELNVAHDEKCRLELAEKLRKKREDKKQQQLEEVEFEKAELKRLKEKYPDEY